MSNESAWGPFGLLSVKLLKVSSHHPSGSPSYNPIQMLRSPRSDHP